PITKCCVVAATITKHGLHATASRTMSFGPPNDPHEVETATRVFARRVAASIPGATAKSVFDSGQEIANSQGFPHEWRLNPTGHLTGWRPVETPLAPTSELPFEPGCAVTWIVSIGAALCEETFLVGESPPVRVTRPEDWPIKRIHIEGTVVD